MAALHLSLTPRTVALGAVWVAGSHAASLQLSHYEYCTCMYSMWYCRELWYRASLAWREILSLEALGQRRLVVGHNAVNQALICTALGLPAACFRRCTQV